MGGAVSTTHNNNSKKPNTVAKVGGGSIGGVVSLPDVAEHLRLYQNAISSDVLVLIDQDIASTVKDPTQWHQLDVSPLQKDYLKSLKITVNVPSENLVLVESDARKQDSVPSKNEYKDTEHDRTLGVQDNANAADDLANKMTFRHIADTTSDSMDGNLRGTHMKATLPKLNDNEASRASGKPRGFKPYPYFPLSFCKLPDTGNRKNGYYDDDPKDILVSGHAQSKPVVHDFKAQDKVGLMETREDYKYGSTHGIHNVANQKVTCSICGVPFFGISAVDALNDHQYFCEATLNFRRKLDKDMLQMQYAFNTLQDLRKSDEYLTILGHQNRFSTEPEINVETFHRRICEYVKRVKNLKFNNVDLSRLQKLHHAMKHEITLLHHYCSDAKSRSMSLNIDLELDNHYKMVLTRFHGILTSVAAFLDMKCQVVKEYEGLLPKISEYPLLKIIGKGGFGTVFLSKKPHASSALAHSSINSFVAIKAINKDELRKAKGQLQLLRERYVMAHSNSYPDYFVRLFNSFQSEDYLFLAMEYVPGGDCMTLLSTIKVFPEVVTQHFIAQVCLAVKHLHEHGVVHRDIKPDNVMITSRGHAKLGDFGLVASYSKDYLSSMLTSAPVSSVQPTPRTLSIGGIPTPTTTMGQRCWLDFSFEDASGSDAYASNNQMSMGSSSSLFKLAVAQRNTNQVHNNPFTTDSNSESHQPSTMRQHSVATLPDITSTPYQHPLVPTNLAIHAQSRKSHKRQNREKLNSRVGNFYYSCPEIVIDDAYDHTVDWWAVAVLCFHFVSGVTPFEASTQKETLENIYTYNANWNDIPSYITNDCKLFIASIITKPLEERLGYESSAHVLQHVFFADIDFNTLYNGFGPMYPQLTAPNTGTTRKEGMETDAVIERNDLTNPKELPLFTLINEQDANEIPDFSQPMIKHKSEELSFRNNKSMNNQNNNSNWGNSNELLSMINDFQEANDFEGFNYYA